MIIRNTPSYLKGYVSVSISPINFEEVKKWKIRKLLVRTAEKNLFLL